MSHSQQYPTIVLAGADPAWMFDIQKHLRAIVGWDYDLLMTFSAQQALRYVNQHNVRLLITEAMFLRHSDGSGAELARRAREHRADIQVLLIHDGHGLPHLSSDINHTLPRKASSEDAFALLQLLLTGNSTIEAANLSSPS